MKLEPVGKHGIKLTRIGLVNCYLVHENDSYTLIDTGLKGSEQDILNAAGDVPVKRILLTHSHVDHVGSVDASRNSPASSSSAVNGSSLCSGSRLTNHCSLERSVPAAAASPASHRNLQATSNTATAREACSPSGRPATSTATWPSSMNATAH